MTAQAKKTSDKLAYGINLIFFGILFLLKKMGLFAMLGIEKFVMDWRNFFFYAGIIFLFAKKDKTLGIILICIGLIARFNELFGWLRNYSDLFWPVLLIVAGIILTWSVWKK